MNRNKYCRHKKLLTVSPGNELSQNLVALFINGQQLNLCFERVEMESTGNSFFHIVAAVVIFAIAVLCLLMGTKSVVSVVRLRQEEFSDKALYESVDAELERVVDGDWVLAHLMTEPKYDVKIETDDGSVRLLKAGTFTAGEVGSLAIDKSMEFLVSYEYGAYGGIKAVYFKEI